jgi:general nucleoside transport system permease protein
MTALGAETAELIETPEVVEIPTTRKARLLSGAILILVGLLCVVGFGFGSHAGFDAHFQLSPNDARVKVPTLVLPARITAIVLGLVVVGFGGWRIARGFSRRAMRWVVAISIVAVVFAFLCWACTGQQGTTLDLLGLLQQTVFLAVPLILGALAGVLCERSGVINIAIEGQMLTGAFAGALVATLTHNLGVGIAAAMVAGGLVGALLAFFAIKYLVNQIVLGVVVNLLALGLTGYVYDALMAPDQNTYNAPPPMHAVDIPGLSDIPILGPLLFRQNVIVYSMYLLIIVIDVALLRSRWGLRTRAVGEHPKAADTVGINVRRTRYVNVVLGGLVAGLAGAYLTLGEDAPFGKNMTSGKGFIALAAVIFGRWSPRGAVGAALLFGFANALQTVLSFIGTPVVIPSQFLAMLPYLATILAVAGLVGRVRAPAADGEPYVGR